MCTTARVCVCDCLYLKKKNEAERHLGSGLNGKSPYQVSAQQLKMQLNSLSSSSSSSRRRLLSSGLSSSFYCTHQTQLVGSRHFSGWHFHLLFLIFPLFFCVCVISPPPTLHPFFCLFPKKDNQLLPLNNDNENMTMCTVHNLFWKSSFIFSVYSKKFPFLFRHLTFGDLWHTGIPKKKRKENRNEFRS